MQPAEFGGDRNSEVTADPEFSGRRRGDKSQMKMASISRDEAKRAFIAASISGLDWECRCLIIEMGPCRELTHLRWSRLVY